MTLYRAHYQSKQGRIRKMTLAAQSMREAWRVAQAWEMADDRLQAVATVRPLARPQFDLLTQEAA